MFDKEGFISFLAKRNVLNNPSLPILPQLGVPLGYSMPVLIAQIDELLSKVHERKQLLLPNLLEGESIAVFSDYGGEHKGAQFNSYSLLFCEFNSRDFFLEGVRALRKKHGLDIPHKEIAYKSLGYGPLRRALWDYLRLADNWLNGLLVNVAIDKNIYSVFHKDDKSATKEFGDLFRNENLGDYKPIIAEKVLRITHLSGYFLRLLGRKGQKLFWMSDHDSIHPKNSGDAFGELYHRVLTLYMPEDYFERIGYASPFEVDKRGELPLEDILSLSDLSAGAVEHVFSKGARNEEIETEGEMGQLFSWLSNQGLGLKKVSIVVNKGKDNLIRSSLVNFKMQVAGAGIRKILYEH